MVNLPFIAVNQDLNPFQEIRLTLPDLFTSLENNYSIKIFKSFYVII